jgi:hypothetical protein
MEPNSSQRGNVAINAYIKKKNKESSVILTLWRLRQEDRVQDQSGIHREILSQNKTKQMQNRRRRRRKWRAHTC